MKELIENLIEVEEAAHRAYLAAGRALGGQGPAAEFMEEQARDEQRHAEVLRLALAVCVAQADLIPPAAFRVDRQAIRSAVDSLDRMTAQLEAGAPPSPAELVRMVETLEVSDWNHLLAYVTGHLKSLERTFRGVEAEVRRHKDAAERFVRRVRDEEPLEGPAPESTPPPKPALLVVEDHDVVAGCLAAMFEDEFVVVTAVNGRDGLERLGEREFDVVVSDIEMPLMDGFDFCRAVMELHPRLRGRFIFHATVEGKEDAIARFGVKTVAKPASLDELRQVVKEAFEGPRTAGVPEPV